MRAAGLLAIMSGPAVVLFGLWIEHSQRRNRGRPDYDPETILHMFAAAAVVSLVAFATVAAIGWTIANPTARLHQSEMFRRFALLIGVFGAVGNLSFVGYLALFERMYVDDVILMALLTPYIGLGLWLICNLIGWAAEGKQCAPLPTKTVRNTD